MSRTFEWCKDKTKLGIWDKQVFCVDICGNKEWRLNDKLHRENGPAVEWGNGSKSWWVKGELHRENGPSLEWSNGYRAWFLNGIRHRVNGPAREDVSGNKEWWLNGKRYSESQYWEVLKK